MKRLFIFLLTATSLWAGSFNCANPNACTVTCNGTNDATAMNSAVTGSSSNGVITIGAGTCAINTTVNLNKFVTLQGTGALGSQVVTFTGATAPMVKLSQGSGGLAAVLNIIFSNNANASEVVELSGTMDQFRVGYNTCGAAAECVAVLASPSYTGHIYGVIDHNTFTNCDRCIYGEGDDIASWSIDFTSFSGGVGGNFIAGGSKAVFIETNTFIRNNSFSLAGNEQIYNQEGSREVIRYNTFDEHLWTVDSYPVEMHGNQSYFMQHTGHVPNDCFRGQPIFEVYNNTFTLRGSPRAYAPRSGSSLFHDNTITVTNIGSLSEILHLVEEEAWTSGGNFSGNPAGYNHTWPTEDMITDTFVWNNTVNGSALTRSMVDGASSGQGGNDSLGTYNNTTPDLCLSYDLGLHCVIQENRDVYFHAPAASGGRTYYTGRAGAAGWDGETDTMAYTASGANAYYPYTPYTYPHPLVGGVTPQNAPAQTMFMTSNETSEPVRGHIQ